MFAKAYFLVSRFNAICLFLGIVNNGSHISNSKYSTFV
jgi:hypothetical protein